MAIYDAETALKEREASLSALREHMNTAWAELEKEKERTEGECLKFARTYLRFFVQH